MAHEIDTTVNANGSAYYLNTPAWHGLGTVVEKPVNYLEISDLIGINYKVEKVPMFINGPSGLDEQGNIVQSQILIPNHVSTVRTDTNAILGVVGKDYEIVQNQEMFEWMKSFSEFGEIIVESAGSLFGGSLAWALLRMEGMGFSFGRGEKIDNYLMISTSHDGSKNMHIVPTPVRVVCANTFKIVERNAKHAEGNILTGWKLSHKKNIRSKMEDANRIILRTHESMQFTKERIEFLHSVPCDIDILNQIEKKIWEEKETEVKEGGKKSTRGETLRENRLGELKNLYMSETNQTEFAKNNLWGAYNTVTEFLDHRSTIRVTEGKDSREQRFYSTQFDSISRLKDKAWNVVNSLAMEMA